MNSSAVWLEQAAADLFLDLHWTEAREASTCFSSFLPDKQSHLTTRMKYDNQKKKKKKNNNQKKYLDVFNSWNFHVCNNKQSMQLLLSFSWLQFDKGKNTLPMKAQLAVCLRKVPKPLKLFLSVAVSIKKNNRFQRGKKMPSATLWTFNKHRI